MTQPVDSSILHEIVRVVESRRKVPERVQVRAREYLITYLEDHQRRLEEALQRYDSDRLNMLYGQLASKVKYQLLRRLPAAAVAGSRKPAKEKPKAAAKPTPKPKPKPKPKARAKPKPKPKPKPKAKPAKKAGVTSRSKSPRGRSRATKAKLVRGKTRKTAKRVAARKTAPARGGKRGSKRKLAKK